MSCPSPQLLVWLVDYDSTSRTPPRVNGCLGRLFYEVKRFPTSGEPALLFRSISFGGCWSGADGLVDRSTALRSNHLAKAPTGQEGLPTLCSVGDPRIRKHLVLSFISLVTQKMHIHFPPHSSRGCRMDAGYVAAAGVGEAALVERSNFCTERRALRNPHSCTTDSQCRLAVSSALAVLVAVAVANSPGLVADKSWMHYSRYLRPT